MKKYKAYVESPHDKFSDECINDVREAIARGGCQVGDYDPSNDTVEIDRHPMDIRDLFN